MITIQIPDTYINNNIKYQIKTTAARQARIGLNHSLNPVDLTDFFRRGCCFFEE